MTRQIKFRAWAEDWDTHKMQMFYDVQCAYDTISCEGEVTPHDQWDNFSSVLNDEDAIVMQFTGLLDKNGKEIYEGDIVEYRYTPPEVKPSYSVFAVEWQEWNPSWSVNNEPDAYEVIGNIYEHPELLKTK